MTEIVMYQSEDGFHPALTMQKRKFLHVVMMGGILTVKRVPISEGRYMQPLLFNGKPYPRTRAAKIFRRYAKAHGITKSALRVLRSL